MLGGAGRVSCLLGGLSLSHCAEGQARLPSPCGPQAAGPAWHSRPQCGAGRSAPPQLSREPKLALVFPLLFQRGLTNGAEDCLTSVNPVVQSWASDVILRMDRHSGAGLHSEPQVQLVSSRRGPRTVWEQPPLASQEGFQLRGRGLSGTT